MFWERLSLTLEPRDMLFADQGTAFYGGLNIKLPPGAEIIGQPIWASIGYTLPALLGAQLADPSRRAILVIGDGAAQMTVQELGTFFRHGLKPLIFLLNNDGYTIERAIHNAHAKYHDIARWEWSSIPAAFGAEEYVRVFQVRTQAELDEALNAASSEDRMVMVEVRLRPEAFPEFLEAFITLV